MLQNKIWAFQTAFSVVALSIGFSFVYNKFKGIYYNEENY